MDLESLYLLVTEAVLRAEALQDLGAPGAPSAFLDLSLIEEEIAKLLPASDPEGAIARRGAVRAAILAGDVPRSRRLVDRFADEAGTPADLHSQLDGLLVAAAGERTGDGERVPAGDQPSAPASDRPAPWR